MISLEAIVGIRPLWLLASGRPQLSQVLFIFIKLLHVVGPLMSFPLAPSTDGSSALDALFDFRRWDRRLKAEAEGEILKCCIQDSRETSCCVHKIRLGTRK